jgi:hypothetical protein
LNDPVNNTDPSGQFTLIEGTVVVVIVAILTKMLYDAYHGAASGGPYCAPPKRGPGRSGNNDGSNGGNGTGGEGGGGDGEGGNGGGGGGEGSSD